MVASRKDVTSPRGRIESRGYAADQFETRRSSTAYLSPSSSKQPVNETKKLQRKDRRQSCPVQMSPPGQSTSIFPSTHTRSTSHNHSPVASHTNPARNTFCLLPSSPLAMPPSSPSQLPMETMSSPQLSTPAGPAPPSAVLLRDLVRDRSPAPSRKPSPISPNISPTHSRHASLASSNAAALLSAMPPIREDRRSMLTAAALADRGRRASHISALTAASASNASLVSAWGGPVGQGRRESYYQYGEDYITRYDRVGMAASPAPSASRTSLVYSVDGGLHQLPNPSQSHLGSTGRAASRSTVGTGRMSMWEGASGCSWGDLERDVERADSERSGSGSAPSEITEKSMMRRNMRDNEVEKRDRWVSWPRVLAFLLAVLALTGIAVGIAFGVR